MSICFLSCLVRSMSAKGNKVFSKYGATFLNVPKVQRVLLGVFQAGLLVDQSTEMPRGCVPNCSLMLTDAL